LLIGLDFSVKEIDQILADIDRSINRLVELGHCPNGMSIFITKMSEENPIIAPGKDQNSALLIFCLIGRCSEVDHSLTVYASNIIYSAVYFIFRLILHHLPLCKC